MPTTDATVKALLARHGRTYADEAGIRLRDTPAPLFRLLVLASLLSANTSSQIGVRAAAAVGRSFPTAARLAEADEQARWQVLADARSLRKRQHADQLGHLAQEVLGTWRGDLRRTAEAADGDVEQLRGLLRGFTGIGEVGADVFVREVQGVWPWVRPFADGRVTGAARALGLPIDAAGLAGAAGTEDLSVLGAALVRCGLADDADAVLAQAG